MRSEGCEPAAHVRHVRRGDWRLAVFGRRGQQPVLTGDAESVVGEPFVLSAPAPSSPYEAVFEDDGETGYFYGLDTRNEEDPIVDALHVYNVVDVVDRAIPSRFQVGLDRRRHEDGVVRERLPARRLRLRRPTRILPHQLPTASVRWLLGRRSRVGRRSCGVLPLSACLATNSRRLAE